MRSTHVHNRVFPIIISNFRQTTHFTVHNTDVFDRMNFVSFENRVRNATPSISFSKLDLYTNIAQNDIRESLGGWMHIDINRQR